MVCLSRQFRSTIVIYRRPSTPGVRRPLVWPLASSLATTKAIEFSFFSSGYLDVSLPRVPPTELLIHSAVTGHYPGRVPPFGYSRINAYLQLPVTFRSLSRPSSAISALASTLRSYSLDLCLLPFTLLRLLGELLLLFRFFSDFSDFFLFLTCAVFKVRFIRSSDQIVVGWSGLEPPTSRLSGECSNRLSYQPTLVENIGLEPMTSCLQSTRSSS